MHDDIGPIEQTGEGRRPQIANGVGPPAWALVEPSDHKARGDELTRQGSATCPLAPVMKTPTLTSQVSLRSLGNRPISIEQIKREPRRIGVWRCGLTTERGHARLWLAQILEETVARAEALVIRSRGQFRARLVGRSPESGSVLKRWTINQQTAGVSHLTLPDDDG